mgnify:CR=1 FL=1
MIVTISVNPRKKINAFDLKKKHIFIKFATLTAIINFPWRLTPEELTIEYMYILFEIAVYNIHHKNYLQESYHRQILSLDPTLSMHDLRDETVV